MSYNIGEIVKDAKNLRTFGYERYENYIFIISEKEKDNDIWTITSLTNSKLKLFLRSHELRKATKKETKQYKLETKAKKYNL